MKKIIVFILVLSLALSLCACSRASQIPSLAEIAENGAEWDNEQLQQAHGLTLADLEKAWGKADGELSGVYGYFWKVNDTVSVYVLYYPENAEIVGITVRDLQDGDNTDGTETTTVGGRKLTLDDVVMLSQKGDSLSWSDFERYQGQEIGSGLYIMRYEIDELFDVLVGGVPNETPMYIRLRNQDINAWVDLREDSVERVKAFIEVYRNDVSGQKSDGNGEPAPKVC